MTVGELLHSIRDRVEAGDPAVGPDDLDELGAALEAMVEEPLAEFSGAHPDRVVRMPKARVAQLGRCERLAVAVAQEADRGADVSPNEAMLAGAAADRFVAHQLMRGRVLEPYRAFRSMLDTEADFVTLDTLDSYGEEHMAPFLDPIAGAVAQDWADVDDGWLPRVQSDARLVLGRGAGICRGLIDVELGGRGTAFPAVVIEVKSSTPRAGHAAETYLYALMVALRDRRSPESVARWYPTGTAVELPVSTGVLDAAALALGHAVRTWVDLQLGTVPQETPGSWCGWCPAAGVCPSARDADRSNEYAPDEQARDEDGW